MKKLLLIALLLLTAAACDDKARGMDVRTYQLNRLPLDDALALVTPYIREGGHVSGKGRLISVREHEDRLTVIEDLLRKYDGIGEAVDVVLQIQVIEANGFTTQDPAIADIEATLRETFKYRGYRLAGETRVQAREGTGFRTTMSGGFVLAGELDRVGTGTDKRIPIQLQLTRQPASGQPGIELGGTVTGTIGKPTVLGQSTNDGAIILVLRPTIAKP
jgi:hypothetical protein